MHYSLYIRAAVQRQMGGWGHHVCHMLILKPASQHLTIRAMMVFVRLISPLIFAIDYNFSRAGNLATTSSGAVPPKLVRAIAAPSQIKRP